jgi:hypothetical protein
MAILIALLLSFTSPSTLPIDLAESGCEICASSEQSGAAMCGQGISINVVRVLVTLHEYLYLKRKVVVELCSSHLQRIIYGIDLHYSVYVCQQDIYWLIYPFRH